MISSKTLGELVEEYVVPELFNTIYMLVFTVIFSLILGCIVALIMIYTSKDGLKPNRFIHGFLEIFTDVMMSMPIVVLAVALFPVTTFILGTCVGKTAAILPLTVVTTPMFSKFIYDGLLTVNKYMIQAAVSFGASDLQILWIMLKETVPSIISGVTISSISVLGVATMMGAIGAGGIGAVAITYGYRYSNYDLIWVIVLILIVITALIQFCGDALYKKWR